jgi:type IV fimbrial biogenesis protein FimT
VNPRLYKTPKYTAGFTLIEIMIVTGIVGILGAIAIPSLQGMMRSTRISAAASDLTIDFALARSEAVKRNRPVSVCPSSNGTSCTGADDWAVGRIIYLDFNGDGVVTTTTSTAFPLRDRVIAERSALTGGVTMSSSGLGTDYRVTFRPLGTSQTPAATFNICVTTMKQRQVTLSLFGRAEASLTTTSC